MHASCAARKRNTACLHGARQLLYVEDALQVGHAVRRQLPAQPPHALPLPPTCKGWDAWEGCGGQWEHAKPCADAAAAHASEAAAAPALKGCTQQRTRALSHELDAFQAAHPTPKTHAGVQHSTAQRTDVPQRELSALLVAHHPARQRQAAGLEGWAQKGGAEHGPAINSGGGGSGRVRAGRHGRRQAAGHGTTLRMW